jgi:hypothetical protein
MPATQSATLCMSVITGVRELLGSGASDATMVN